MTDLDVREFLLKVESDYDVDVYIYNSDIDDDGFGRIIQEFSNKTINKSNALLILTTYGGLANSAYKIARFFQDNYKEFYVAVPSSCKSAGTIIALGANSLILDGFSELGPLDVQLLKADELGQRKSGLLPRSSFTSLSETSFELFEYFMLNIKMKSSDLISFKAATEISASITSNLMAPIYAQINPDVIGNDYRELQVARYYGYRLADIGQNTDRRRIDILVDSYPSHNFIIDKHEAQNLFDKVSEPSENLYQLYGNLMDLIYPVLSDSGRSFIKLLQFEPEEQQDVAEEGFDNEDIAQGSNGAEVEASGAKNRQSDTEPAAQISSYRNRGQKSTRQSSD